MHRGIGPQSGFAGGLVVGAYIGSIVIVAIAHEPVGWVLLGCALIAHAIRDTNNA